MSRYLVLKTLPQGQEPGAIVELNDDEAYVFMTVEAVRPADGLPADDSRAADDVKPRRRYQRRDLQATEA